MKKMTLFVFAVLVCLALGLSCAVADEAGSFRFDWFAGGAMGMQFTEITVDEEADILSIWPNCTVTDVVLEKMDWTEGKAPEVLYTADTMESNQVINLKGYLSDAMPAYRITCVNAEGETERWYLDQSGEDGSLFLLEREAIENVLPEVFDLSVLRNVGFELSSGVGAWSTELFFGEDGTFRGGDHDSDMGDTGEGYPYGTVYGCLFTGHLSVAGVVNESTWLLKIDSIAPDEGQLPEVVEDGIRYITTGPAGLEDTTELMLYLPGTPLAELPEEFVIWTRLQGLPEETETLPCYGIYNAAQEAGFIGSWLDR